MSQLLHLATETDFDRLMPMVAAYHAEEGIESDESHRAEAIRPLLQGSPLGAIWLIGPKMSPVGYVCACFGWSIELGGMDGFVDELWIREKVRGRGMGGDALVALQKALSEAGLRALHLEIGDENPAERLYYRAGFRRRKFNLMTWMA